MHIWPRIDKNARVHAVAAAAATAEEMDGWMMVESSVHQDVDD